MSVIVVDGEKMDAISTAVALIDQNVAVSKMNLAAKMVRQNEESKQGLIDMIVASADAGGLYSSGGNAVVASAPGGQLNASA